jgi:hydroxymethylpyrimidine/phosphomethylpyrimidine kinase
MTRSHPPLVMVFAGNDPTGGAGLTADTETLVSLGCRAAPVVTAITMQDTAGVKGYTPLDAELIVEQARAVLEDMPVAVFKTGMLASPEIVTAISAILEDYPDIPLVVDPVMAAGDGESLSEEEAGEALQTLLLPRTTLITPNSLEARALATGADTLDACAQEIMSAGCEFVLITGTHESTADVVNRLYGHHRLLETYHWDRLPHSYHGSGCTLAAACAATMAHGIDPLDAIAEAQEFTWQALRHGWRPGMGQHLPDRLFWAREEDDEGENGGMVH